MYDSIMIRTQIYLTKKQHQLLKKRAYSQKATLSEALRQIIDKDFLEQMTSHNTSQWLLSMAEEAKNLPGQGPTDLASKVDKYLYEEK